MNDAQAYPVPSLDPRFGLGMVAAIAALLLLTNPPKLPDPSTMSLTAMQGSIMETVGEWRPHGPPPWMDADQFTPEEVEELPHIAAAGDGDRGNRGDARARPER